MTPPMTIPMPTPVTTSLNTPGDAPKDASPSFTVTGSTPCWWLVGSRVQINVPRFGMQIGHVIVRRRGTLTKTLQDRDDPAGGHEAFDYWGDPFVIDDSGQVAVMIDEPAVVSGANRHAGLRPYGRGWVVFARPDELVILEEVRKGVA